MWRRSADQYGGRESSRSGQLSARTTSGPIGDARDDAPTAGHRDAARGARTAAARTGWHPTGAQAVTPSSSQRRKTWENASAIRAMSARGRQHVVAAALNDRCVGCRARAGSSCSSTIGQRACPGSRGSRYWIGSPREAAHACAVRSAQPRTDPSGSSSPDALRERVAGSTRSARMPSDQLRPPRRDRVLSDRRGPVRGDRRAPHVATTATTKNAAKTTNTVGAPPAAMSGGTDSGARSTRSGDSGGPAPTRSRASRSDMFGRHGVQRAPRAEVGERQRHPAAMTKLHRSPVRTGGRRPEERQEDGPRGRPAAPHLDEPRGDGVSRAAARA